jgi:uncharacterized protein (DUF2132 family)
MTHDGDSVGSSRNVARKPTDPMQGMTLEAILVELVDHYGWDELGRRVSIRCFTDDPSVKSSLKFLRKTPWARAKVDALFVETRSRPTNVRPEHER